MIEKQFLNFLARFYSHLWLPQGYVYRTLKIYRLLDLELAKVQTVRIFDNFWGWDKLISEYFEGKIQLCFF